MKISKTTYTSPILKNKYTCLRSSSKESNERKNDWSGNHWNNKKFDVLSEIVNMTSMKKK
jgi:hypothetical protein